MCICLSVCKIPLVFQRIFSLKVLQRTCDHWLYQGRNVDDYGRRGGAFHCIDFRTF